jgi:hypothetical protein
MSGVRIFNAAMNKMQETRKNLLAIKQARQKMEQDNELFDLRKKKAELDLETANREGKVSDLEYDILSVQNKEYLKQEEQKRKGTVASIKIAEHQQRGVAEQALNWAKIGFKSDPRGVLGFLQARKANEERTFELRPKMSAGKIGYETVDLEQEKEKAVKTSTVKRGYTDKDILSEAQKMADDDSEEGLTRADKVRKYIPEAKRMFEDVAGSEGAKSSSPKRTRNYKAGDKRNIKGTIFIRNENGEWTPQD